MPHRTGKDVLTVLIIDSKAILTPFRTNDWSAHPPMLSEQRESMMLRYIIAWIPMVFIAVANGILRKFGNGKYMDALSADQVASVTGIIFFVLFAGKL
jgi:hypothetical protein